MCNYGGNCPGHNVKPTVTTITCHTLAGKTTVLKTCQVMYYPQPYHSASMENFHSLCQTPSPTDAPNSQWFRTSLSRTRRTRNWAEFIVTALKIFCLLFFRHLENFVSLFVVAWKILLTLIAAFHFIGHFGLFGHFSQCFWASFTSQVRQDSLVHQKICGLDAQSSAQAISHRTPPKFSAQSTYYVGHIWHNVYFSSLAIRYHCWFCT